MADRREDQRDGKQAARNREARDTEDGCRDRAADDLARAAQSTTANARTMLERSAASWRKRADNLDEKELGAAEQRIADKALWDSEEDEAGDGA